MEDLGLLSPYPWQQRRNLLTRQRRVLKNWRWVFYQSEQVHHQFSKRWRRAPADCALVCCNDDAAFPAGSHESKYYEKKSWMLGALQIITLRLLKATLDAAYPSALDKSVFNSFICRLASCPRCLTTWRVQSCAPRPPGSTWVLFSCSKIFQDTSWSCLSYSISILSPLCLHSLYFPNLMEMLQCFQKVEPSFSVRKRDNEVFPQLFLHADLQLWRLHLRWSRPITDYSKNNSMPQYIIRYTSLFNIIIYFNISSTGTAATERSSPEIILHRLILLPNTMTLQQCCLQTFFPPD